MNKKSIKIILSFLIMLFCIGIKEVRAEVVLEGDYVFGEGNDAGIVTISVDNEGKIAIRHNIVSAGDNKVYEILANEEIEAYYRDNKTLPQTLHLEKKVKSFQTSFNGISIINNDYTGILSVTNIEVKENFKIFTGVGTTAITYSYISSSGSSIRNPSNPDPSQTDHNYIGGNCEELLGREIIDFLNEVFNVFKIVVPIIIVGFGILDFSKAIFSGDEGEMKKAQGKFVKRLIYGIIFFFIPMIVMLIIELLNKGWGTCGIQ